MKKIICFLVLFAVFPAFAQQTVSGYVYDEAENKPLEGAFVYLDGTSISAITDSKGQFSLSTATTFNGVMVVSFVGFKSFQLENPFGYGKPVKIMLQEDAIQMQEVVISGKTAFTRKQMLRVFRQEFLGESAAGSSCTIENEDDVQLYYDTSTNTLNATALKPLRIKNKRLQYNVVFDLSAFNVQFRYKTLNKADLQRSFYAGTTFFTDLSKKGSADKRRKETYLGSTVHFMKTIANNTWQQEKFGLYVEKFPVNPDNYFAVSDSLNMKKVSLLNNTVVRKGNVKIEGLSRIKKVQDAKVRYAVLYDKKQQSFFEVHTDYFFIDSSGLFYPVEGVIFGGHIAALKAGDLLPLDYNPN